MINGGHFVILSKDPNADRAFFRDVLKLTHIDAGNGWLIFVYHQQKFSTSILVE
jgi:hypothetical protein